MLLRTKIISAATAAVVGTGALIGGIVYFNEKPLNVAMENNQATTQEAITQISKANIIIGQLNKKVNNDKETINNLNKQLKTSNAKIEELQKALDAKQGQEDQSNADAKNYKSAFETEVAQVNKANSYVQNKAKELNNETQILKDATDRLKISTSNSNVLENANLTN